MWETIRSCACHFRPVARFLVGAMVTVRRGTMSSGGEEAAEQVDSDNKALPSLHAHPATDLSN